MSRTDKTNPMWVRIESEFKNIEPEIIKGKRSYSNIPEWWWATRTRKDEKHYCHSRADRAYSLRRQKRKVKALIQAGRFDEIRRKPRANRCFREM